MRVVIAGSRWPYSLPHSQFQALGEQHIQRAVRESGFQITEVVSGAAQGIDVLAGGLALRSGVSLKQFPARWRDGCLYDWDAGKERNQQMADYADALIAVWVNGSTGTNDMILRMHRANKPLYVLTPFEDMWPQRRLF